MAQDTGVWHGTHRGMSQDTESTGHEKERKSQSANIPQICGLVVNQFKAMAASCLTVFFIMAVIILPHRVNCILRCYSCTSYESWEDCNSKKNLEKAECPSESPECIQGVLTCTGSSKQTIYFKGCAAQGDSCDAIKESAPSCISGSPSFDNTCCTGKYCNSGSSQKISSTLREMCIVLLLLWGLLAAFVY